MGAKSDGLEVPFLLCLKPTPRFLQVSTGLYSHHHSQLLLLLHSHYDSLWIVSCCFCKAWRRLICETWLFVPRRHIYLDCLISLLLKNPLVTSPQFHIALVSPCLLSSYPFLHSSFLFSLFLTAPPLLLPSLFKAEINFLFFPVISNFLWLWLWLLILMPSRYIFSQWILKVFSYTMAVPFLRVPFLFTILWCPTWMPSPPFLHPVILIDSPPHSSVSYQWHLCFLLSYLSLIVWHTNAMATLQLKVFLITFSA